MTKDKIKLLFLLILMPLVCIINIIIAIFFSDYFNFSFILLPLVLIAFFSINDKVKKSYEILSINSDSVTITQSIKGESFLYAEDINSITLKQL
jgi:hypothetical protein